MITNKKELQEWMTYEREKYYLPSNCIKRAILLASGNEYAIIWSFQRRLRITEYYYNTGKKIKYLFSKIILNKKRNKYGLHIGLNICGKGLKIMHLGSILTNGAVKIGEDVSIHINTSFVAPGISDKAPVIDDGVIVGVGAVVLGDVYVAKNVAIGANAVVTKSVFEENIAIAGVPAKKVSDNGRTKWNNKQ